MNMTAWVLVAFPRLIPETQVVEEAPISDEKEKLLLDMIDQKVLHGMVDLVVEAKEGKIDINALKQVGTGCCNIFKKN